VTVEHLSALPNGFQLQEYRIDRILGYGGFGITYLATDTNLDKAVAIKEYLPNELAVRTDGSTVKAKTRDDQDDFRWGLDRFVDEARTLARFRHANLVPVHRFFEAHGTAYMVMEYEPGESLADILRRTTERAPEAEVRALLAGVLSGLEVVHAAGFLHRDIKPSNIIVRPDGTPVLIDFGAARQAVGRRSRNITSIVTPGYAPLEQYTVEGNQGPWTDIYAIGAVLYQILSGKPPPDATSRARNDPYKPLGMDTASPYSQQLRDAIDWALRFDEADRPQSIAQWREALAGSAVIPPISHNDQVTRVVSADRQTVANPAGPGAGHVSSPGGRHSVLDNAAPGAVTGGLGAGGQTQVVPPPVVRPVSARPFYIAMALTVVVLGAAAAGTYVALTNGEKTDQIDSGKTDPGKTDPGKTDQQQTDEQKKTAADAAKKKADEDAQKKAAADAAKKKADEDAQKKAADAQKKVTDDLQKKLAGDPGKNVPAEINKGSAENKNFGNQSTDKARPNDPDGPPNSGGDSVIAGGTPTSGVASNPGGTTLKASDASLKAASQARDVSADARRIATDARTMAETARDRAHAARDQVAPAARKAAGAGARTQKYDSGATYTGAMVNNKRQGLGVLDTPKGYHYEGQWANDSATGLGVSNDEANKERYEGEWRNGDRNGRGVYTWPTGQKFEGEYRDGARNGLGVLTQADGEREEVQWQDGKANGRGVIYFTNGERYEGEFGDGKFNGRGVYTWIDGQHFEGGYRDDKRYGYGILYLKDGSRQSGFWEGTTLTRPD